ncbi:MAG TPA: hypothetical protein PKC40_05650 [Saprospiraceae bacterium]|nr:hypothetical protein [Saprospiraceae bacterium]
MKFKVRFLKPFVTVFLIAFFAAQSFAQFAISNAEEIAKIKNGTTYIVMKDPASPAAQPYIDIYKKYWTFSKIEFIKYSEIEKYLSPENSFFTIGSYATTVQYINIKNGVSRDGISYTNTHLYLALWSCDKKFFKSKKKELTNKHQNEIARIELFTDFETLNQPEKIYDSDYDGGGHIRNWSPGILKNYIQQLMVLLKNGKENSLYKRTIEPAKLKALKKQILYVPDYTLIKFSPFNGDESKKLEEKEIFEDYKYAYSIISMQDLNDKILNATEPFYYLIYVKSSTDKYLTVMNAATGEVIYTVYSAMSYNIKSNDLEDLSDKIEK